MLVVLIDLLWAASAMTRPGSLGFAHIVGVLPALGVFCAHAGLLWSGAGKLDAPPSTTLHSEAAAHSVRTLRRRIPKRALSVGVLVVVSVVVGLLANTLMLCGLLFLPDLLRRGGTTHTWLISVGLTCLGAALFGLMRLLIESIGHLAARADAEALTITRADERHAAMAGAISDARSVQTSGGLSVMTSADEQARDDAQIMLDLDTPREVADEATHPTSARLR